MKKSYFLLFLLPSTLCLAQGITESTKQEISHLITYLENSGCEFKRNGVWHDAKAASQHINKKYQYLLEKNLLTSTESFIEHAASESSMSGKPYAVKCGNAAAVASADWFKTELDKFRKN